METFKCGKPNAPTSRWSAGRRWPLDASRDICQLLSALFSAPCWQRERGTLGRVELLDFWSVVKVLYSILYLLKRYGFFDLSILEDGIFFGYFNPQVNSWAKTWWISGFPRPAAGTRPSACGRPMRCVTWKVLHQLPLDHLTITRVAEFLHLLAAYLSQL